MAIAWLLFGALIGYAASQKRGFSSTAGVLGGLLLGIFSPLLFFVTGDQKKCPSCAEWVQKDASICKHCRTSFDSGAVGQSYRATEPKKTSVIVWVAVGLLVASIAVLMALL